MRQRAKRSKRGAKPSSASGGSSTEPSQTAWRKPVIGSSLSPACRPANGAVSALQMQSNGYTRSSSAGSRRRPYYHPPIQPPCCSGRCLLAARSTCARSTAGKPSPHRPSISQLTSQLDPIPSVFPETASNDPVLCIMIAAALTWAAHSSVATVLLFMSVAYSHFVTPYAALALVLGANLGSAINPVLEAGRRDDLATYRLPVGNLLNRVVGILLVLPFLHPIADTLSRLQPDASRMTAEFHIAFNVGIALVF